MQFTSHAVAYLDILGFKNFVCATEKDPNKLSELDILINTVLPREVSESQNNLTYPQEIELKCLSVSDSIIISSPVGHQYEASYPALISVSIKCIQIAHALLNMGLLVRGAVTLGNVFRTDRNIVGTGYQDAVEGEKNAKHPQIVLCKPAEDFLNNHVEKGGVRYGIFTKNESGQIILNSIHPHEAYVIDQPRDLTERFQRYREIIVDNLAHTEQRTNEKWTWFAHLFNANVQYFSNLKGQVCEITLIPTGIELNYLNPLKEDSDWITEMSESARSAS